MESEPHSDASSEFTIDGAPFEASDATPDLVDEATTASAEKLTPKKKQRPNLKVWVPLTFPTVPKRGDFDVSMLRDSAYFFS
jgi:DNA-directed RNA polymerase